MSIIEKLKKDKPTVSVEFFPPKTEDGARQLFRTAHALQEYGIVDFVSVTYGAGGSTREKTIDYGQLIGQLFDFDVMPHLTCVGHSKEELIGILNDYKKSGFKNIMTLRGDPPKGETSFKPHPDGLAYGSELVKLIRDNFGSYFSLGVGGYPERHPESPDGATDIKWLKHKVDQGADFITTQLFFDNNDYFEFVQKCRQEGIEQPILPGILLSSSLAQVKRFCGFCGAKVPAELERRLGACETEEQSRNAGTEWALEQIRGLLRGGAPGLHLYILNRHDQALSIFEQMSKDGIIGTSNIVSSMRSKRPTVSIEFFTPKTEDGTRQMLRTAKTLSALHVIDFASVTYGAGGSTRDKTIDYGQMLSQMFEYEMMPHLTCVGHSKQELLSILQQYKASGFRNIMTLRGDPPKGETEFKPHPDGLAHASELVSFIRENFGQYFTLGVAGYPELHPESPDLETDIKWLKHKVQLGADFITTQLFFDNNDYVKFAACCRDSGIHVPILPGLLLCQSLSQVKRFCGFCHAKVPQDLEARLEAVKDDEAETLKVGVSWTVHQIKELLSHGAPGFHLYILNRHDSALEVFNQLLAEGLIEKRQRVRRPSVTK